MGVLSVVVCGVGFIAFWIALIAAIRPIKSLHLGTRTRAGLALLGSVFLMLVGSSLSPTSGVTEPTVSPVQATKNKAEPLTKAQTLPGRMRNTLATIDLYIRDDLTSQEGHRDRYAQGDLPNELKELDDWGTLAFEGRRANLSGQPLETLENLLARASVYQVREFPRYRQGFGVAARNRLWEKNIEVRATGPGNRTLLFIGGDFFANRNIAAAHDAVRKDAERLRFKHIEFRPYEAGGRTRYDIENGPADSEVGVWVGKEFMSATKPGAKEQALMLQPRKE